MLKVFKYLKPFFPSVIAIVGLLLVQAVADLALPDYTSRIVNIGIQQGGIKNAVPKFIRKTELDKLRLFINQNYRAKVDQSYTFLDKNELSQKDYAKYLKKYPIIKKEVVAVLKTRDNREIEKLNSIMAKVVVTVSMIEKNGWRGTSPSPGNQSKQADPFAIISKLPPSQVETIKRKVDAKLVSMPDSMMVQAAIPYLRHEYQIIGIDTNRIQNRYILDSGAVMLLIALGSMAASVIVGFLGARVAAGVSKNLRKQVFEKVVSFSNPEFDRFSTASLITRSTNDIQQIQLLMAMLLRIVFYAPILGIGGVFKVINSESSMSWIIALAVGAIFLGVTALFGMVIPKFKKMQQLVDRLNLVTREILTGILVIRAFNTQNHEEAKFDEVNQDLTQTALFINRMMSLMMPGMMLIMNGITLLIVWVGAHRVNQGAMQVGDMMAFIQYAMQIIMAFLMISIISIMLPRATVSAERINEVLDTEITVKEAEKPEHFGTRHRGFVEFEHVSFRYPGAEENVLEGISFVAKPGEVTAFIGSTGSGKSTLVNLILRFYDVTGGRILVNGTDIRTISLSELRNKIGYIPQKAVLFSGTIESNLKYGAESATPDEVRKAAETAQALEFIEEKPEKFQEGIAQGGANVSGGQKQRLSIARAIAKRPDVYIFDDSFSALDYKTDATLRKALRAETAQSTVLIVAQRISTIMSADQIIVLEDGKIAGKGRHQELLQSCEVYRQIAFSQLSKEELVNE